MLERGGLCLKDLRHKIVEHWPTTARECCQKLSYLLLGSVFLQSKGEQAQTGSPSLQAGIKIEQMFCRKMRCEGLVQKFLCLLQGEAQVCGAYLAQLIARAQPGQGQRWLAACADDQMEGGWL